MNYYLYFYVLAVLMFVDMMDGAESIFSQFLPAILKDEWELTEYQVSSITGVFFFGSFIGLFLVTILSDKFGRKITLIFGNIC